MPGERRSADPPASRDRIATTLKWVGAVTSILSLIFGLYQLTNLMAGVRERKRLQQRESGEAADGAGGRYGNH